MNKREAKRQFKEFIVWACDDCGAKPNMLCDDNPAVWVHASRVRDRFFLVQIRKYTRMRDWEMVHALFLDYGNQLLARRAEATAAVAKRAAMLDPSTADIALEIRRRGMTRP